MSPMDFFLEWRRTVRRIAMKFCIANGASFVPLLVRNRPDRVKSWRFGVISGATFEIIFSSVPYYHWPKCRLYARCRPEKWPHLTLHCYLTFRRSSGVIVPGWPRPILTLFNKFPFYGVSWGPAVWSVVQLFLMPLDCLRGKSGAFSPSLPKGHVTMRVMLPPFALCVRFFFVQSRYLNNQGLGGVAMLLWF